MRGTKKSKHSMLNYDALVFVYVKWIELPKHVYVIIAGKSNRVLPVDARACD